MKRVVWRGIAGEEPTYAGVQISTIVEKGVGVGDVISLLWFKRSLPAYCTRFIEVQRDVYGVMQRCTTSCAWMHACRR